MNPEFLKGACFMLGFLVAVGGFAATYDERLLPRDFRGGGPVSRTMPVIGFIGILWMIMALMT